MSPGVGRTRKRKKKNGTRTKDKYNISRRKTKGGDVNSTKFYLGVNDVEGKRIAGTIGTSYQNFRDKIKHIEFLLESNMKNDVSNPFGNVVVISQWANNSKYVHH